MIYLDHNATAPLLPEARAAMEPFLGDGFGNPSSVHRRGQRARLAVERARDEVGRLVGARDSGSILFTSGATEALNLALRGVSATRPDLQLAMSAVEHPAVQGTVEALAAGRRMELLAVDDQGRLDLARAAAQLVGPAIVAVMAANNETGVIQEVRAVADMVHARGGILVVDAAQAAGRMEVDVEAWGADLVALSAHKMGGPAGAGALVVAPGVRLAPVLTGGPQERTLRGGTENVAAIAGFGAAAAVVGRELAAFSSAMLQARERLEGGLSDAGIPCRVLGAGAPRLPNTSAVLFPGVDAETLVFALDLEGFCASAGSACASGSTEPSHVLRAMGLPLAEGRSCVRFSSGATTKGAEVDALLAALSRLLPRMRGLGGEPAMPEGVSP